MNLKSDGAVKPTAMVDVIREAYEAGRAEIMRDGTPDIPGNIAAAITEYINSPEVLKRIALGFHESLGKARIGNAHIVWKFYEPEARAAAAAIVGPAEG